MEIPSPVKDAILRKKWIGVRHRLHHEGYRAFIMNPMTRNFLDLGTFETAYDAAKFRFLELLKMDPALTKDIQTDFVPDIMDADFYQQAEKIIKRKVKETAYNVLNYETMGYPGYGVMNTVGYLRPTVTGRRTRKRLDEAFPGVLPRPINEVPTNNIYTMHLKNTGNVIMDGGKGRRRRTRRRRTIRKTRR